MKNEKRMVVYICLAKRDESFNIEILRMYYHQFIIWSGKEEMENLKRDFAI